MSTILFLKTFSGFKGFRDIDPSEFIPALTYRGRCKYKVVIIDGKPKPIDFDTTSAIEIIDLLRTVKGQALISIYGKAHSIDDTIIQPITFTKDNHDYIALYHGLYNNAVDDISNLIKYYMTHSEQEFVQELLQNKFLLMIADAAHYTSNISVYVGQLPFSFEQKSQYVMLGTIHNSYTHQFTYSKVGFTIKNRKCVISELKPLGKATRYYPLIQHDKVSNHVYADCNVAALYDGHVCSFIATIMFLDKCKVQNMHVNKLDLICFDANETELSYINKAAKYFKETYDIPAVNVLEESLPNVANMKDLILVSHAAAICEQRKNDILLVDYNLDTFNPVFYYNISNALTVSGDNGYYLSLLAPALNMNIIELMAYCLKQNISLNDYSIACHSQSDGQYCDDCQLCQYRRRAVKILEDRCELENEEEV